MPRYIDSDIAYALLNQEQDKPRPFYNPYEVGVIRGSYKDAKRILANVPAADVKEVVHGKWEYFRSGSNAVQCTCCRKVFEEGYMDYSFCPDCGADMRESEAK